MSQFEDQPVIADGIFDYTDALHDESVPIVIDNGNSAVTDCLTICCHEYVTFCFVKADIYSTVTCSDIIGFRVVNQLLLN